MPGTPEFPQTGGCVCGAVRYQLNAMPLAVYTCHCKDCQRMSNGTHTISMVCKADTVELISGALDSYEKVADSGRTVCMQRCAACGTPIWNEPLAAPDTRILKAGNLDDISWAKPIGSIWAGSRAPWVEIDPMVPNFDAQPADRTALIAAWAEAHPD